MLSNLAFFFAIKQEIAPDFDMQQDEKEDRWHFRLLVDKNENNKYNL
jgi:hypothetical protein